MLKQCYACGKPMNIRCGTWLYSRQVTINGKCKQVYLCSYACYSDSYTPKLTKPDRDRIYYLKHRDEILARSAAKRARSRKQEAS